MKHRFVIGIDPGVSTGFAVYDRQLKRIDYMNTLTFWAVYDWFIKYAEDDWLIYIESPPKTRLYERQDKETGERRREKIAANVGSNSREAELLADGIERMGFEVKRVKPTRKKWTAQQLKIYTGIKIQTNQHVRDAIALVWGI